MSKVKFLDQMKLSVMIIHGIVFNLVVKQYQILKGNFFKKTEISPYLRIFKSTYPVDTGRKLKVHNTFRRRPGHLLNVSCTFNLRPVSTGYGHFWFNGKQWPYQPPPPTS